MIHDKGCSWDRYVSFFFLGAAFVLFNILSSSSVGNLSAVRVRLMQEKQNSNELVMSCNVLLACTKYVRPPTPQPNINQQVYP